MRASPRFTVRRSSVHGRGVFAATDLAADVDLLEYRGEVVEWREAQQRYERSTSGDGHTFFFDLGDGRVIDGGRGGNSARWFNHGCDANCEAVDTGGRIVLRTRRAIRRGEELLIDYQLDPGERRTAAVRRRYACRCGAPDCRGTMLAT